MTGFPALLHRPIIIFCARKTFSVGISIPRSPRATMMPSDASRISSNLKYYTPKYCLKNGKGKQIRKHSNLLTPSWFSIFAIILMFFPASPRILRISLMPAALRMNDANTMSTFFSTPNVRSDLSFSDTAGRSTGVPGRLQPFFEPREPPFSMTQRR